MNRILKINSSTKMHVRQLLSGLVLLLVAAVKYSNAQFIGNGGFMAKQVSTNYSLFSNQILLPFSNLKNGSAGMRSMLADTFTVSINPEKDNTIYERNSGNSNGAGEYFIAGTTGSPYKNRALLQFNIAAAVPAGAVISNVSMTLHLAGTSGNSNAYGIELHKVLQAWGEGASNAGPQAGQGDSAEVNDATWVNAFFPGTNWTTTGGNFSASTSGIQTVNGIGFYTWSSIGMVSDVQNWLMNPAANFGWLLKSDELASFQAKRFSSRENAILANRPTLNITYILNPPNIPPSVSITSPLNNSTYAAGDTILLNAIATDTDGSITKVVFYANGVKFYEDLTAPYGLSADDAEPGNYAVFARAFDNSGDSATSSVVNVLITGCTPTGSILGEGYTNIPGTQVSDLTNHPSYPNNPSIVVQLTGLFEYSNVGINYGGRIRGYICAPLTGNYTFYIAGDDQAGLFLSTDDNPTNKRLIAYNVNPVGFRIWNSIPTQKSLPIRLVKGARYYIETLHKQGSTPANHLSVRWVLPNGVSEAPIPGSRLSPVVGALTVSTSSAFDISMRSKQSVRNVSEKFGIKILPNPSPHYFILTTQANNKSTFSITITDILGRVVETKQNIPSNGTIIIGENLLPGIYFAQIIQGSEKKQLKLIKQ
ncbi:MAG: DNRLRE domain-containing protein [Chitinophagaceae bacterium]